jgi:mono/diheme cytochrome c family protein
MRKFIWGVILAVVVFVAGGLGTALSGFINTDADQPPGRFEKWLARETVEASISKRAAKIDNPLAVNDANLIAGMKTYLMACAECHGGADKKPSVFVALPAPAVRSRIANASVCFLALKRIGEFPAQIAAKRKGWRKESRR